MSIIGSIINIFANLDENLVLLIQNYGILAYPILFIIIFLETGLVVTPFLPGDSLIFAAGTLAAKGLLNIIAVFTLLSLAAILGDTLNYWIGKNIGEIIISRKYVKKEYLDRTHGFYEKYGGKTIIIARFVPIIRTFAPFVAGIGKMSYLKFLSYNVIGGVLWVFLFSFAGFFFGNIPFVKNNFSIVILVIIFISLIPAVIEYFKYRKN